ncbi:MAG: hypothetical protein P8Y36_13435 [Alphaproteobacteria bacterium]
MNAVEIIKAKALLKACKELILTARSVMNGQALAGIKVEDPGRMQNILDACIYTEALIRRLETILDERLSLHQRPLI